MLAGAAGLDLDARGSADPATTVMRPRWAGALAGRWIWFSEAEPMEFRPGLSQSSPARVSQPSGAEISAARRVRHAASSCEEKAGLDGAAVTG